jgi:hypothetical protein
MDPDRERKHLAQADRHIAAAKKRIARQRVIVQAAIDKGQPSEEAEAMLAILERSLRAFERHRQSILDALAKGPPQSN